MSADGTSRRTSLRGRGFKVMPEVSEDMVKKLVYDIPETLKDHESS